MENHAPWMDDDLVRHIPKEKLDFLSSLSLSGQGKSQKEMMTYMMSVIKKAKEQKITFTPVEIQTIITAIQKYSSPEELAKMNEMMKKIPKQNLPQ